MSFKVPSNPNHSVTPLQLFSQPQMSEHRAQTASLPLPFQQRLSGQGRGEQRSAACSGITAEAAWKESKMTSRDLFLCISAVQKNSIQLCKQVMLTLAIKFTANSLCSEKSFSTSTSWQAALLPFRSTELPSLQHPTRQESQEQCISQGPDICTQHGQDQALWMLTGSFQSDCRATVYHSCPSSNIHHSSCPQTELPSSQATLHSNQVFLHSESPYIRKLNCHPCARWRSCNIWANKKMASAFGKKKKPKQLNTRQIAFGGGTIWVPIDELPIISYWKFLFSSVYKLCQNLTVLAEITHARCLPQADFCWIASSKMSQLFPRTKLWKNTLFCPC